jgi:uncharacterized membrane protein
MAPGDNGPAIDDGAAATVQHARIVNYGEVERGRSSMQGDRNWHERHAHAHGMGERVADTVANLIGSWKFIIAQSVIFVIWVIVNTLWLIEAYQFDPYPFILFNLFMSAEAAYASPLILMSQNRQAERDRHHAEMDYETNVAAKEEIEAVMRELARLEIEKLDRIMAHLGIAPPSPATAVTR